MQNSTTAPDKIKPSFSGHETFPFRYTWLKKGVDAVREDPAIFTSDRATITLGAGKNMVRSIRHWCTAAGLIRAQNDRTQFEPTLAVPSLPMTDSTHTLRTRRRCGSSTRSLRRTPTAQPRGTGRLMSSLRMSSESRDLPPI